MKPDGDVKIRLTGLAWRSLLSNVMRTLFFCLLCAILPASSIVAGDYIIVVDASQSMKGFIKVKEPGKIKPRIKNKSV